MLPVEIWQKTKCLLILEPRHSHNVGLYLLQGTSSLRQPMYICLQQMPILYLVCDADEVTGALDISVLNNIFNRSSSCQIANCNPRI